MTRTFIRTTALTISMAASVTIAAGAVASGYLAESPYEVRRQEQAAAQAFSNLAPSQPLDVPQAPPVAGVLVPPTTAVAPTRTLLNTTPNAILTPSKPLYPGRALSQQELAAHYRHRAQQLEAAQQQKKLPLPGAMQPVQTAQANTPLIQPGISTPTPVAPAFQNITPQNTAPAPTVAGVPARLPLPTGAPQENMPTFKPYATLETQKEIPIDPRVFNVQDRSTPVPAPIKDPQLAPLNVDKIEYETSPMQMPAPMQLPLPSEAPAIVAPVIKAPKIANEAPASTQPLPLPALDGFDVPEPIAPKAVAAPLVEPSEPAPSLSKESKRILSNVPKNLDTPKKDRKRKVSVNRIDPDVQGILDANVGGEDDVQTHESVGVKIQVRRPKFNADYELEKAYNALMAGQTEIAIDIYKGILKQAPGNQPALFGLATTYHRVGNLDNARPLYGKLIGINPNHREALNNFLVLVAEEAPEEALRQLEELEAKNPDFSPIPAQMALLLNDMGSPEAARKKMIRAAMLSPDNLAYKYNLAIMMDNHEKYSDAAALYKQLIQAGQRGETLPADINDLQERLTFIVSNKL